MPLVQVNLRYNVNASSSIRTDSRLLPFQFSLSFIRNSSLGSKLKTLATCWRYLDPQSNLLKATWVIICVASHFGQSFRMLPQPLHTHPPHSTIYILPSPSGNPLASLSETSPVRMLAPLRVFPRPPLFFHLFLSSSFSQRGSEIKQGNLDSSTWLQLALDP